MFKIQEFWSDPLSSEVQIKAKEVICSEKQSKMVWLREIVWAPGRIPMSHFSPYEVSQSFFPGGPQEISQSP